MSGDHPNYSIVEIEQNTEKSPGDIEEICCHSDSRGNPSANTGVKNSQKSKIISDYSKLAQKEYKTIHDWNRARNLNFTILPYVTCTNQNLSEE